MSYPAQPAPRVEVIYFMGKTGGFATKDSPLGRVQLVSEDLSIRDVMPWNQRSGFSRAQADDEGKEWAEFLKWPLVTVLEKKHIDVTYSYEQITQGGV